MRIAAVQLELGASADEMAHLLTCTRRALDDGALVVALPERPVTSISPEESTSLVSELTKAAGDAGATIIGCNLPGPSPSSAVEHVPVVSPNSAVTDWLPVGGMRFSQPASIAIAQTPLGKVAVLHSLDCFAPVELSAKEGEHALGLVMQVSAASPLELEAIRELALARSEAQTSLVIVASLSGGRGLCGGTAIMCQGEVLAEAGDHDEIVTADIDPADFVDLALLHHDIRIPELLKQKLEHA